MSRDDDLRALLARVEASKGDRDLHLEAELLRALAKHIAGGWRDAWYGLDFTPLTNTDHAVALIDAVLPGWSWSVGRSGGRFRASVTAPSPLRPMPVIAKDCTTGGLVLIAALLSALITQEVEHGR